MRRKELINSRFRNYDAVNDRGYIIQFCHDTGARRKKSYTHPSGEKKIISVHAKIKYGFLFLRSQWIRAEDLLKYDGSDRVEIEYYKEEVN